MTQKLDLTTREPNAQYILSLSYGKDSLACLGAIEKLGWPLDRIVHAEVWATDTIPADLPPMVEFKVKADAIIKERYGIEVEHVCAVTRERERERLTSPCSTTSCKKASVREQSKDSPLCVESGANSSNTAIKSTFENIFYKKRTNLPGVIRGFPSRIGPWCNSRLKVKGLTEAAQTISGGGVVPIQYLGIAADEPERLARLDGITKVSPLAAIGWTEADCMAWCKDNDLVSPIYTTASRGGCWFCHNQGVDQLRLLRKNYPQLWALLLKWDSDSPVKFHSDGHTVHDFDKRFMLEDLRKIPMDKPFRWKMLDEHKEESGFTIPKVEL